MHDAGAAFSDVVRRLEGTKAKVVWLAEQGLLMGHLLPPGAPPAPSALPFTLTMLGTAFGGLASNVSTTGAHQIARNVLIGEPAVAFTGDDAPMMEACVDHLRVCFQRLRTMADDHAIEVLLEVVAEFVREVKPAIEGS